jgi:hypothetical protein
MHTKVGKEYLCRHLAVGVLQQSVCCVHSIVVAQDKECAYYTSSVVYRVKAVRVCTVRQDKWHWAVEHDDGHAEVVRCRPVSTVHAL